MCRINNSSYLKEKGYWDGDKLKVPKSLYDLFLYAKKLTFANNGYKGVCFIFLSVVFSTFEVYH